MILSHSECQAIVDAYNAKGHAEAGRVAVKVIREKSGPLSSLELALALAVEGSTTRKAVVIDESYDVELEIEKVRFNHEQQRVELVVDGVLVL